MEIYDVKGYQDFKELMSSAGKKHGILSRTNIYYLGDALIEWSSSKLKFFYVLDGICFIKQENNQNKLYYALSKKSESMQLPFSNIITEVICRDGEKKEETQLFLKKSGFELKTVYLEMIKKGIGLIEEDGNNLVYANHDDCDELLTLWGENLNILEHPLPDLEKLNGIISNRQVIVLKNEDIKIIAAMVVRIDKKIGYIEYVVVDKSVRNVGLGKKLMDSINKIPFVEKWFLFVSEGNQIAQRLYSKCGFTYSGRQLLQYYKI